MKTRNKNFFIAGKTLVIGSALALSLAGVAQAEIQEHQCKSVRKHVGGVECAMGAVDAIDPQGH